MSFKICVIGCGAMSDLVHGSSFAKYAAEHGDTVLAACCDLDPDRAGAYRKKYGFLRSDTDYITMLNRENPTAVSIISPVQITAELSCAVMKMGYPVIMEKPPGMDGDEVHKIARTSDETGCLAIAAFNRRYMPHIRRAREIIQEEFDSVSNIYYTMIRYRRFDPDFSTTTIHAIDAARFLAGSDYKTVRFTYQAVGHDREAVNIYVDAQMESGANVRLDFVVAAGCEMEHFVVNGFDRTLSVFLPFASCPNGHLQYFAGREPVEELILPEGTPDFISQGFYDENKYFFDSVKGGATSQSSDIRTAYQSVVIAECIRRRKDFISF